jgi:hypothetical protein
MNYLDAKDIKTYRMMIKGIPANLNIIKRIIAKMISR